MIMTGALMFDSIIGLACGVTHVGLDFRLSEINRPNVWWWLILTLSNAFIGIDNREMKSESGFSFVIASQPFKFNFSLRRGVIVSVCEYHHFLFFWSILLDLFNRRGQVYKRNCCLSICLSVRHHFLILIIKPWVFIGPESVHWQCLSLREGYKKSKWKFKMAFAMKGGGVSRGSRVPHTYFEKWFF